MPGHDPLGPVVITARDIYDALVSLRETVGRLVDQGVGHADDIRDHEDRLRRLEAARPAERLTDVDARVKGLEAARWPLPTLSVLIAAAALAFAIFTRG